MSPCEETLRTLVSGEPLSESQRAHRDGCPRCQGSSRLVAELSRPGVAPKTRPVPSPTELQRRSRRRTAVRAGLAGAALLLLGALQVLPREEERPDVDILAALSETEQIFDAPSSAEVPPGTELLSLWDTPVTETDPLLDDWSL
ncbi:MAG TPA: hypothetical protein PKY30_04320 [Myxococcota bacterium]|nr:hypothetical protein [Myxococcota bacterium]